MANIQNIRIKVTVSLEEMEFVTGLFRQANWNLAEIGDAQQVEDQLEELYVWTLDVTEEQKDAINFAVTGAMTTIWEEPPPRQGVQNGDRRMVIKLTEEQERRFREIIEEENWDAGQVIQGVLQEDPVQEQPEEADGGVNPENIPRYIVIQPRDGHLECEDCFSQPCVMHESNRQGWWPNQPEQAKDENRVYRRRLYKDFHTMLYHRGVWGDDRYIAKKSLMNGATIRREIMPDCVCRQVRLWYPNKPGDPYMGHKNA